MTLSSIESASSNRASEAAIFARMNSYESLEVFCAPAAPAISTAAAATIKYLFIIFIVALATPDLFDGRSTATVTNENGSPFHATWDQPRFATDLC